MMKYWKIAIAVLLLGGFISAEPLLSIRPDTLKFGYISSGGSTEREFTLFNVGDLRLRIESCDHLEAFNVDNVVGLQISPGDSAVISAVFRPTGEGSYESYFVFTYNNFSDPQYELPVVAEGISSFERGDIIWSFQHIDDVVCVSRVDDVNGDGLPEVVAEGYDNGAQGQPLVCLSGSGAIDPEVVWSSRPPGGPSNSGGNGDQCLKFVSDLNGDGHGDIIRGTSWNGRTIAAIDGITGDTIWTYDTSRFPPTGWIYSVDEMEDITGDGVPEVLAGIGSDANRAYCLNGATGEFIWRYVMEDGVAAVAAIPDVNDDGYADAILAPLDNGVYAYCITGHSEGNALRVWRYYLGENSFDITIMNDINSDGHEDVVIGTWGRGLVALSGQADSTGHLLWTYNNGTYTMRVVTCPDLDGDGYEDILVGSWGSYAEAVSGRNGSSIWRTPCGSNVWAIDYVDDINNDGIIEVVAGSFNHNVYLLDGSNGDIMWQKDVGARILTLRGTGDINGDGYADVIAGTQMENGVGGQVFMLSGWGAEQTYMSENDNALPRILGLAYNYPNPFNSTTIIRFSLVSAADYTVSIYDITGRLVDTISGSGLAGTNSVTWSLPDRQAVSSGVYFYKIAAGSETVAGKMTYLK